jgi:hypothetical protein
MSHLWQGLKTPAKINMSTALSRKNDEISGKLEKGALSAN